MPLIKAVHVEAALSTEAPRQLSDTLWAETPPLGHPKVGRMSESIARANLGGFKRHPMGVRGYDAGSA
jgi:hypothetical protein